MKNQCLDAIQRLKTAVTFPKELPSLEAKHTLLEPPPDDKKLDTPLTFEKD